MNRSLLHIIWVAMLVFSLPGSGQTTSPLGRFEVDFVRGCSPLTVTLTDISGGGLYLYDADTCNTSSPKYNPTLCPQTNTTTNMVYTYTQPGTYLLTHIDVSQNPRLDTIRIEVLPPQPPEFHLTLCNNNSVHVNIIDTYYDQFLINYGDGSPSTPSLTHTYPAGNVSYPVQVSGYFNNGPVNCGGVTTMMTPVSNLPPAIINQVTVVNQAYNTGQIRVDYTLNPNVRYIVQVSTNGTSAFKNIEIPADTTINFVNLNTIDSVYCYRISAVDRCNNTEVYSNTVCSTSLQVVAQDGQNQVNWNTFATPEFSQYEVLKNNTPLGPPINSPNIKGTTDTSVECNVLYCYQIITSYNDGGRSLSISRCVFGINNQPPSPISSLTASVDGGSITLDWIPESPINFYRVFRSENNGPFEAIGEGTSLPYLDVNLRPQLNTYCYYVIYQNSCGRQSEPSVVACAIKLEGRNVGNKDFALNWTQYAGWQNGISAYELEILDESGALLEPPISLGSSISSYRDPISRQLSYYRVVAISNDAIPERSYSNLIEADIPLQIFVPNSFTPNNDGLNDTFSAKGLFIESYSMEIYSRWGELLYHTENLEQGWTGYYNGSLIPEGTYVYKITATDPVGRLATKRGTIHLLRK